MEDIMGFRDLVPWTRNQQLTPARDAFDPFWTLHREMNRLFDDVFRGFGSLGRVGGPLMEGQFSWPRLELGETDKTVTVSAELPGLTEQDVQVEIANGVLSIRGEKKAERNDETKFISERYYGSFERQIPLEGIEEDKAKADFKNGVLTVTLPRSERSSSNVNVLRSTQTEAGRWRYRRYRLQLSLALTRLSRKEQKETRHEPGRSHRQQCWALFPPCIPLRFTHRCLERCRAFDR
jgi:HSP20 family protein